MSHSSLRYRDSLTSRSARANNIRGETLFSPSKAARKDHDAIATEKQIEANRRNGQKRTGPKTREGKFKSSLNALKHGMFSHQYVLGTEDEAVFNNQVADLINEFNPQTPSELELVEILLHATWRRRRISTILNQRLNKAVDDVIVEAANSPNQGETAYTDTIQITKLAVQKLEASRPSFARQETMEFCLAGLFQRTLRHLHRIRDQKLRNETNFELRHRALAA